MKVYAAIAFVGVLATGGSALAADVDMAGSSVDWSGYYVGASSVLTNVDAEFSDPWDGHIGSRMTAAHSDELSGAGFGAHIGYLKQQGKVVIGSEIFVAWNDANSCVVVRETDPSGCPYGHSIETEIEHVIGADLKVGLADGSALYYGLAGVSWSDVKSSYNDWDFAGGADTYDPEGDSIDTHSDMAFGLRFGGGAEFKVTESMSVFAQAVYTRLDTSFLAKNLTALKDDEDTGLKTKIGLVQANLGVNFNF